MLVIGGPEVLLRFYLSHNYSTRIVHTNNKKTDTRWTPEGYGDEQASKLTQSMTSAGVRVMVMFRDDTNNSRVGSTYLWLRYLLYPI